jgi:hypothetical protein
VKKVVYNATLLKNSLPGRNACWIYELMLFMYIPNKPRNYGLETMVLNDETLTYIYFGKDSDGLTLLKEKKKRKLAHLILRLASPIHGAKHYC